MQRSMQFKLVKPMPLWQGWPRLRNVSKSLRCLIPTMIQKSWLRLRKLTKSLPMTSLKAKQLVSKTEQPRNASFKRTRTSTVIRSRPSIPVIWWTIVYQLVQWMPLWMTNLLSNTPLSKAKIFLLIWKGKLSEALPLGSRRMVLTKTSLNNSIQLLLKWRKMVR